MLEGVVETRIPEIWALERLLALGGVDPTPSLALGLAGGAGFVATTVKGGRKRPARLHVSGWNSFQTDVVGAVDRLGMIGHFDETTNRRAAAAALEGALDDGAPVALWVDGALLSLGDAADVPSPMVVLAARRADGTVEVTGPGAPSGAEAVVIVDAATLGAARDSIPAHRNRLLTVRSPSESLSTALRAGLATMAVGSIGGPRGRTGPEGVHRLARAVTGRGFGDWRTTFDGGWPLLAALSTLAAAIRREQGLLRASQACLQRTAAELLAIPALLPVADAHDGLAAGWLEVADHALPADLIALEATRRAEPTADALAAVHDGTFPIGRADLDAILAGVSARVAKVAVAEDETLTLLRATLRAN